MRLLFTGILLALLQYLFPQDVNTAKMDSLFTALDQNHEAMGSLSVFYDGKEVYQKTIGFVNVEKEQAANAETTYHVGSVSKMFTAVMIMQLVDEGKLNLGTSLSKYFPEIENAKDITIEHLLRHRTGIFNFTNAEDYLTFNTQDQTREQLLEIIKSRKNIFQPNEKYSYSNSNYVLLSFIIEDITEKLYAEVLQEKIAKPCGLASVSLDKKIENENNEADSYNKLKDWKIEPETSWTVPLGAGAIVSTSTDLNKFLNCLFVGDLLSDASLEQLKKQVDGYGLGTFEVPFHDKKAIGHTGGIDGFQSNSFYFPEDKLAVSYISNGVSFPVNDILIGVLSIYFGKDYEIPVFTKFVEVNKEILDSYDGTYSAPTFPLKIDIRNEEGVLLAQATGQPELVLKAENETTFTFEQADVTLIFNAKDNQMTLKQFGQEFILTRE